MVLANKRGQGGERYNNICLLGILSIRFVVADENGVYLEFVLAVRSSQYTSIRCVNGVLITWTWRTFIHVADLP